MKMSTYFLLSTYLGPSHPLSSHLYDYITVSVALYLCFILLFLPSMLRLELACPRWREKGGGGTGPMMKAYRLAEDMVA
jgi:hypothetical protein